DGAGMAFIGFDEIRLNNKLPGATETQLQSLAGRGIFKAAPGAATITGATPLEARVKSFIYGNCVHCHNDVKGSDAPMDLHPDVLVANVRNVPLMGHIEAPPGFLR